MGLAVYANKLTVRFWLAYTLIFLFIDGWHWHSIPESPEAKLDAIVLIAIIIENLILFYCTVAFIQRVLESREAI